MAPTLSPSVLASPDNISSIPFKGTSATQTPPAVPMKGITGDVVSRLLSEPSSSHIELGTDGDRGSCSLNTAATILKFGRIVFVPGANAFSPVRRTAWGETKRNSKWRHAWPRRS